MAARHGIVKPLEAGVKPEEVFEAAQAAFKKLGWEVYKKRPIAFLVEGRTNLPEGYILANVMVKVFGGTELSVIAKSDTVSQEIVESSVAKIYETIEQVMAAKN